MADVGPFAAGMGGDTIPALAGASAAAVPRRVAVTVDGDPLTHAELDDAASRVVGWLAPRVRPGDRVPLAQVFQRAALPRNHVGKIVRGALR